MKKKFYLGSALAALAVSLSLFAGSTKDEFTAHEWGTFTSVQGANGVQLSWNPFLTTDLPQFVYNRAVKNGGIKGPALTDPFGKINMSGFIRMETPVIYFYSDRARTADVRVSFPAGRITEWYPQATHVGPFFSTNPAEKERAAKSVIEWIGLKILPRETKEISAAKLIRDAKDHGDNHYYAARETDANFVRMDSPHATGAEYERDLFYRGLGNFQAPLTLRLDADENHLRLSTTDTRPLTDLFVLTVRDGQARYQKVAHVERGEEPVVKLEEPAFAPLEKVRPQLMREMAAALRQQGLFAKEAQAMVETWKDQWFADEGTRVLYLLSGAWTDATLPLEISPKPSSIVRVMVGRAELITPAMERELQKQVLTYQHGDTDVKLQALHEVRALGLGRFLEPATRRVTMENKDQEFVQAAWKVAQEAGRPTENGRKLAAF
jgi:hypothetical protein